MLVSYLVTNCHLVQRGVVTSSDWLHRDMADTVSTSAYGLHSREWNFITSTFFLNHSRPCWLYCYHYWEEQDVKLGSALRERRNIFDIVLHQTAKTFQWEYSVCRPYLHRWVWPIFLSFYLSYNLKDDTPFFWQNITGYRVVLFHEGCRIFYLIFLTFMFW